MKYSTYNDNRYNATVHKDNNKLDVKVGNPENKKHVPGAVIEYGVKSVNGKYGDVVLTYEDVGALPDTTIIAQYIDDNGDSHIINSWNNTEIDGSTYIILTCDDTSVILPTDDALNDKIADALNQVAQGYVSYQNTQTLTLEQQERARLNIGVDISQVNDYRNLINKPSINGVELNGNLTSEDLGISSYEFSDGLINNDDVISAKLGNGLEFDTNKAIQIEDGIIFNCGTSNTVI